MSKDLESLAITRLEEYRYRVSLTTPGAKSRLSFLMGLFATFGIKVAEASLQTSSSSCVDTFEVRIPGEIHWHFIDQDLSRYAIKTSEATDEFRKLIHQRPVLHTRLTLSLTIHCVMCRQITGFKRIRAYHFYPVLCKLANLTLAF